MSLWIKVHIAKHRNTGEKYAIKSINKHKLDPAQLGELRNEVKNLSACSCLELAYAIIQVELLRRLDHPNIVRLYEVYEHGNKM